MRQHTVRKCCLALFASLFSVITIAETSIVRNAEIEWLRASDGSSNTCVVKLNVNVEAEGTTPVDCDGSVIALKCGGTIDGIPSRTFDLAMFAFENRRKISVRIDDSLKFDDICYATRFWVTRSLAGCTDDDADDEDDCDAYYQDSDDGSSDDDPSSDDSSSYRVSDCEGDDCDNEDDD